MHRRESSIVLGRLAAAGASALILAGCSPSPAAIEGERSAAVRARDEGRPSLYGRWRIVEVNGAPPRSVSPEPGSEPAVAFGPGDYGGTTGCNSFGGHGLLVGDRWFAGSGVQTEMGCGDLTAQETAITGVLSGGPALAFGGEDSVTLTAARGSLRLRRIGPPTPVEPLEPPMLLAGTRWTLYTTDGAGLPQGSRDRTPHLTLEADSWTLQTGCGARTGAWRQEEGEIRLEPGAAAPRDCSPEQAEADARLVRALTSAPLRYVVGPNGEFVLAGSETWAAGQRDRAFGGDVGSLWGQWRVTSVNGVRPPPSDRAPEVILGPGAYAVWDGCAHREGVALVHSRQLFTHSSGMVTSANCPDDPTRTRINAVVASSPRIARTADGDLALLSRAGALRLERVSARAAGTGVVTRLGGGMAFDILPGGPARLTLGPGDAFSLTLPCGRLQGGWRNDRSPGGSSARFKIGPEALPAACADNPAARRLEQFLTGEVSVAIGPNRDIALFHNGRDSLAAHVVR